VEIDDEIDVEIEIEMENETYIEMEIETENETYKEIEIEIEIVIATDDDGGVDFRLMGDCCQGQMEIVGGIEPHMATH
jgi:hypothetical protein